MKEYVASKYIDGFNRLNCYLLLGAGKYGWLLVKTRINHLRIARLVRGRGKPGAQHVKAEVGLTIVGIAPAFRMERRGVMFHVIGVVGQVKL